jgi:NAD(P)-dependent dehydrogenase (short-subunit alcohol dehydrogenase family)
VLHRKLREPVKSLKAKTNHPESSMRVLSATTGSNNSMNNEFLDKVALVTGATSGVNESTYAKFLEGSEKTHPIGRVRTTQEATGLVLLLALDKAGWITDVTYSIDGGQINACAR